MKILCNSYIGKAWLLSKSGQEIEVLNHPSATFEFESIVYVVTIYGSNSERKIADQYNKTPTESLKQQVLNIYNNNWCKVRTWGTFNDEITFRITSAGYDWYNVIIDFLLNHPEFKRSAVTVEADKSSGTKCIYWDRETYVFAIDAANETVLASKLLNQK